MAHIKVMKTFCCPKGTFDKWRHPFKYT